MAIFFGWLSEDISHDAEEKFWNVPATLRTGRVVIAIRIGHDVIGGNIRLLDIPWGWTRSVKIWSGLLI